MPTTLVYPHEFSISALDAGKWSASGIDRFAFEKMVASTD
jgi:hypothetical protein